MMQISDYLEGDDVDPSQGTRDHDAHKGKDSTNKKWFVLLG